MREKDVIRACMAHAYVCACVCVPQHKYKKVIFIYNYYTNYVVKVHLNKVKWLKYLNWLILLQFTILQYSEMVILIMSNKFNKSKIVNKIKDKSLFISINKII